MNVDLLPLIILLSATAVLLVLSVYVVRPAIIPFMDRLCILRDHFDLLPIQKFHEDRERLQALLERTSGK